MIKILTNIYNGGNDRSYFKHLGYTRKNCTFQLLNRIVDLVIPNDMSVDFNQNYQPVDIDEVHLVGRLPSDYNLILPENELETKKDLTLYRVGYTLWYDGECTDVIHFVTECLHTSNQSEVEEHYIPIVKTRKAYKKLYDEFPGVEIEIVWEISKQKLVDLDELLKGVDFNE